MRAVRLLGAGLVAVSGAAVSGAVLASPAVAAPAAVGAGSCTTYAYASTDGTDPNGFAAPNETSFVAACLDANGQDVAKTEVGPRGTVRWGQPGTWAPSAISVGFPVGTSARTGTVIEVASGQSSVVTQPGASGTLTLSGPFLGVVVDSGGGAATFRTYDVVGHAVRTYTLATAGSGSPQYLDLSSGHRATAAPATSASASASASATASSSASSSASASPSASPTPTPSATASSATPTPSDTTSSSTPDDVVTSTPPSDPGTSNTASSSHDSHATQRDGLAIATGILLVVVAALLALVRRRRS